MAKLYKPATKAAVSSVSTTPHVNLNLNTPTVKISNLNNLTANQKDFWFGLTNGYLQYEDAHKNPKFSQNVVQKDQRKFHQSRFIPDIEQIIQNKSVRDDLRKGTHPYRFQLENGNSWVTYLNPNHKADPVYAGARMAAEGALAKGTGSLDANSVYIPGNLITLMSPEKQENPFKVMASLMATKTVAGIKAPYNEISDNEIRKAAQEGWKRGIWNSRNGEWSFEEFFRKNKDAIKQLMHRVPAILGLIFGTQNEKEDQ